MKILVLIPVLTLSFMGTDLAKHKTPPLLDNRLFKPASAVESSKIQSLALSIYKKAKINLPNNGKCLVDTFSYPNLPKNPEVLGNILWRRGLSEKEAKRSLSTIEKNDMHNLFPFLAQGGKSLNEKEKCAEFKGSLNYSTPIDFKGDFARACFYMSVQYRISLPDDWEDVMRIWHVMDPPSVSEMDRNSYIEERQKNRNPFIDYPELAERVVNF
jgi:hypothetical protein